ncbi:hypothetical protein BGZ76_002220 [Entomortierella beljakovae]|nr:hypothetical protein BGZ76_002220 [Entomortierella beljakovae]
MAGFPYTPPSQSYGDSDIFSQRSDQSLSNFRSTRIPVVSTTEQPNRSSNPTNPISPAFSRSGVGSTIPAYLRAYISKEPILSAVGIRQGIGGDSSPTMSQTKSDCGGKSNDGAFHSLSTTLFSQSHELRLLLDRISSFDTVLNNTQRCFEDYEKRLTLDNNQIREKMLSIMETKVCEQISSVMEREVQNVIGTIDDRIQDTHISQEVDILSKLETFKQTLSSDIKLVTEQVDRRLCLHDEALQKRMDGFKDEIGSTVGNLQFHVRQAQEVQMRLLREELTSEWRKTAPVAALGTQNAGTSIPNSEASRIISSKKLLPRLKKKAFTSDAILKKKNAPLPSSIGSPNTTIPGPATELIEGAYTQPPKPGKKRVYKQQNQVSPVDTPNEQQVIMNAPEDATSHNEITSNRLNSDNAIIGTCTRPPKPAKKLVYKKRGRPPKVNAPKEQKVNMNTPGDATCHNEITSDRLNSDNAMIGACTQPPKPVMKRVYKRQYRVPPADALRDQQVNMITPGDAAYQNEIISDKSKSDSTIIGACTQPPRPTKERVYKKRGRPPKVNAPKEQQVIMNAPGDTISHSENDSDGSNSDRSIIVSVESLVGIESQPLMTRLKRVSID